MALFFVQQRRRAAVAVLLSTLLALPPCILAWTTTTITPSLPVVLSWSCRSTSQPQRRRTTAASTISLHAYLDDDSSPVNGNSRSASSVAPTTNTPSPVKDTDAASAMRRSQQQEQSSQPSRDYPGAGTLGDIMSRTERGITDNFTGLVTTDGGLLRQAFGIQSPLDRMALTANGNLQRLFSSYYDAPVHVVVEKCVQSCDDTSMWDRVVHLSVFDKVFCTATSSICVHDEKCRALVESGTVGLGQLFRHLDKLPSFSLVHAGYDQKGGLWRRYKLECEELSCHIYEEFLPEMWNIAQPSSLSLSLQVTKEDESQ